MEIEYVLILAILNVFQFIFWSYQVQKLINKMMSKSYYEYEQVKSPPKARGFSVQIPSEEEMSIPDQTRIMDEILNRTI